MEKQELATLPNEAVINKLASTFPAEEQGKIMREVFLVSQTKTTGLKEDKRKLSIYEAFTYTLACQWLGLNPTLNHLIMLDDQVYITLQGHLQNAHSSWLLMWIQTRIISEVEKWTNKNWIKMKAIRYECIIKKKAGNDIAEYKAEWYADIDTIKNKYANNVFIEQMAEARAMRRCLARAFPVWMANIEDIQDDFMWNEKTDVKQDTNIILIEEIRDTKTSEELEWLKDRIQKSWSKEVIAEYSKKSMEFKTEEKTEEPIEDPTEVKEEEEEEVKPEVKPIKKSKLNLEWLENSEILKQSWLQ